MEAKEVARKIHEKLMRQHQQGSGVLWRGSWDEFAEILNEVKREVETPCPAVPDPAPASTSGKAGAR